MALQVHHPFFPRSEFMPPGYMFEGVQHLTGSRGCIPFLVIGTEPIRLPVTQILDAEICASVMILTFPQGVSEVSLDTDHVFRVHWA